MEYQLQPMEEPLLTTNEPRSEGIEPDPTGPPNKRDFHDIFAAVVRFLVGVLLRAWQRLGTLCPCLFFHVYREDWRTDRSKFWKRMSFDFVAGLTVGAMAIPQSMVYQTGPSFSSKNK